MIAALAVGPRSMGVVLLIAMAAVPAGAIGQAVAPTTAPAVTSQPAISRPPAPNLDWFDRTKNPVTWLKWGADERIRWEYYNNAHTLNKDNPLHEHDYFRFRTRLWSTVTPTPDKNVEVNSRLTWEWRNYMQPDEFSAGTNRGFRDTDMHEAIFDNLNVRLKKLFGMLDLTVGRQDITLGDGWLVTEGTPLDGTRTQFFDAARATLNLSQVKTAIDLIYIEQPADSDWLLTPFNHREYPLANEDSRGAILYASNKSLKRTTLDGYYIYKHDELASGYHNSDPIFAPLRRGNQADIHTFGTRATHDFDAHWTARGEVAGQFGQKNGRDLCALGANSQLAYRFKNPRDDQLRMSFEYLSGDNRGTPGRDEGFDILWGRWFTWNDIQWVAFALEGGRPGQYTNLYRVGPGWSRNLAKGLDLAVDYFLLFANQNPFAGTAGFSDGGNFRGQMGVAKLKYKFTDHISGQVGVEVFAPGDYYSSLRNDTAVFSRYELVLSW